MFRKLRYSAIILLASLVVAAPAYAGTLNLTGYTDETTGSIDLPASRFLMATITSTKSQGGGSATGTVVSIGGSVTAAMVTEVCVYYALVEVTCVNPGSLTSISLTIPVATNAKGGDPFDYRITLDASAADETIDLTVESISVDPPNSVNDAIPDGNLPRATISNSISGAAVVAPSVGSPDFASVTDTTATLSGTLVSDGGGTVSACGVEWGTSPGTYSSGQLPSTGGSCTTTWTTDVTGLPAGDVIYFRAYATNEVDTGYSGENSFTTLATVSAPSFTAVTDTTATLGGSATTVDTPTSCGVEWGTSPGSYSSGQLPSTGGSCATTFTTDVTGLPAGDVVYYRAYATNAGGTGYSGEDSFTTLATVHTPSFTAVTDTTATLGGDVTSADAPSACGVEWGTSTGSYSSGLLPSAGPCTTAFTVDVTGLPAGDVIFFRAYATYDGDTGYSGESSFTTLPTVHTPSSAAVTDTTATLGGDVTSADTPTACGVEWGTSTGVYTSGLLPSAGPCNTAFTVNVTSLPSNSRVYFRAYATNAGGNGYSSESFIDTDPGAPTVETPSFTAVTDTTATLGGEVTSDGGAAVSACGVEWGTSTGTYTSGQLPSTGGSCAATFTTNVTGLPAGDVIYFRAYATNATDTGYSSESSFTTLATVTLPTSTDIASDSATLGGTVTSADTPTACGVEWGTSTGSYTSGLLPSAGPCTAAFTVAVTGLPTDTEIFFRAYATNAGGTGYSGEGTFTTTGTEPTVQASSIVFEFVSATAMRFSWTEGNGDGTIAVIRETAETRVNPGDGTEYTANPDIALAPELPTNSNNFVVYSGSNNRIQIGGLTPLTNYTVVVYAYRGSGTSIDYLHLIDQNESSQSTNNTPVHNMDYAPDCYSCHGHAKSSTFVPRDDEQKTLCEGCHWEFGEASAKLAFAQHLTPNRTSAERPNDMVDCGSCHEVHNFDAYNTISSTNPVGPVTANNLSFVRANVDKWVSTATTDDAVFHSTDDYATEGGTGTTARGICQACHSDEGMNHRWNGSDTCHDGVNNDSCGPAQVDCTICHTHVGNFQPIGGGCTGCHTNAQDKDTGSPGNRRAIVGEFARTSSHVADTSLQDSDCEVCHAQSPTDNAHVHGLESGGDYRVTLWNADVHTTSYQLGVYGNPFTSSSEAALLNSACLSCHDSDGAQAEASPFAPFTGSGAPPNINSTWSTSSHGDLGSREVATAPLVSCYGDGEFGCHASGHGSEKLTLLSPPTPAATSPNFSEQREDFCFTCHDSDGPSNINIDIQFNGTTINYTVLGDNGNGSPINGRHDVEPADQAVSEGVVTCKNCHSPHADNDAYPVMLDPDDHLTFIDDYDPTSSYNEDGHTLNYSNGTNQNPVRPQGLGGGQTRTEPDYIRFCLTCHDGTTPAGVTMPGDTGTTTDPPINIATAYGGDHHGWLTGGDATQGYLKYPWNDGYQLIGGLVDVNGDDVIDGNDDLTATGTFQWNVIDGWVDVDGDGNPSVPDPDDDGTRRDAFAGRDVIDGKVDNDGDGDTDDNGILSSSADPATPYAAFNCTICHGPHGSNNIYNLRESITVAGVQMRVGGWVSDDIGNPRSPYGLSADGIGSTTYTLPPITGGNQEDHYWGAWCSFCHMMESHSQDEQNACRQGHMHGQGNF